MKENLKRIQWVDFAKGIAIILVVVAHVIHNKTNLISFIFMFHMPFFFVMAGYLLNIEKWEVRFNDFIKKYFKRIMLPYFLANFSFYPIWFIFCHELGYLDVFDWLSKSPLEGILSIFISNNYHLRIWLILNQLWFLPCLFFSEIIYLGIYKLSGKDTLKRFTIISLLSSLGIIIGKYVSLPLGLEIALAAQIFIFVGNLMRKNNFIDRINFVACVIILAVMFGVNSINGFVTMHSSHYGNPILFYIGGISGSLILMKISMILSDFNNKLFDFVKYCGKQSMAILILHIPIIAIAYNLTVVIEPKNAELGLRLLSTEFETFVIICGIIVPVLIVKKFKDKPIIKYFCV